MYNYSLDSFVKKLKPHVRDLCGFLKVKKEADICEEVEICEGIMFFNLRVCEIAFGVEEL